MVSLSRMRMLISYEQRLQWNYTKKLSEATRITSVLTGMPRGSGNHSQVESGAIRLAEVSDAYREVFDTLAAMRAELEPLLASLDNPDDIAVMRLRYMDGYRPSEIPDAIFLSERSVYYHLVGAERKLISMYPDQITK